MKRGVHRRRGSQRGATAVELAIVAALLCMLLIGIMEMSRMLFYWNSAAEATRLGARMAVVCDLGDAEIKSRMRQMLSVLPAAKIDVTYEPVGCTIETCKSVTVSIGTGVSVPTVIPFVPLSLSLPAFSTSLPRESMDSAGGTNPVCA
jgi:Flp pilus assembly protein TadG